MFSRKQIQKIILAASCFSLTTWAQISPPAGALIVRQSNTGRGEYTTISDAVAALAGLTGPKIIYIHSGTYTEQVRIKYPFALTLQGYSTNTTSATSNEVTIQSATSAAQSGSNVKSATIWLQSSDTRMSNINVINSFGTGTDTQALALASSGKRQVFKYCSFSSFQDTVEIDGSAFIYKSKIEGAVDFIFGAGLAWIESSTLAVRDGSSTYITAQRSKDTGATSFVINRSRVVSAGAKTRSTYLGRPWSEYANVVYQFCWLSNIINPAAWSVWSQNDSRTAHVSFQEYHNVGPGSSTSTRKIGSQRHSAVKIADVLGHDYQTWVY